MKLLIAVMYSDKETCDKAVAELKNLFGDIDSESPGYNFNFTTYYEKEMGAGLKKKFISFKKTTTNEELAEIRTATGKIEDKFRINGKRTINIDPGYISKEGVFMASLKNRQFKTGIGDGIFLHKILGFEHGKIIEFNHTFADYKLKQNQDFFLKVISSS
ncbi:DUF4416 family protein [Candidatus Woesearchaeota archaeon]|nr:DUF4416 family protein [Candidatus Woesearchaeota archaeon]